MSGLSPAMKDLLKQAKAKHSKGSGKVVKLKEGKTKIRILPNKDGKDLPFWHDLGAHWIKSAEGKVEAVAGCHDITYDRPCPICAALDKMAKAATSDEELKFIKEELRAKKSVLVNAIIRGGESADPVILELPSTVFANIVAITVEYSDEYGDLLALDTGMDFTIERTGKMKDTKYTVMPALKSMAVPKDIAAKAVNLAEFIEGEFFAKETKALNALAAMSGGTSLPAATTRAALTGPRAGTVIDADVEDMTPASPPARKAAPAAEAPASPPTAGFDDKIEDADVDDILKELDGI